MTLDQLRIFLEVARARHVTRAAANLNLTQSSVSAAIKTLEERHGVLLFDRIGRGIDLTPEGRAFLGHAEQVLTAAKAAEKRLADLATGETGTIRIFASQTVSHTWLPQHLVRFHEAYPAIEIEFQVGNTRQCLEALHQGQVDIGFIEAEIDDPQLVQRRVGQDQLCLVTGPRHPWAQTPPTSLKDLLRGHWVLREKGSGTRATFEEILRQNQLDPSGLSVFLTLPSNEAVCAAVADSALATVISYDVAQPYLLTGRMVAPPFPLPARPFHLVRHSARQVPRATVVLEEFITAHNAI